MDPIFGYRCDGRAFSAGMVRVVWELTDIVEAEGGGTHFIPVTPALCHLASLLLHG